LDDVDFELELIHRDEINVSYILSLLANLTDSNLKGDKLEKKKKKSEIFFPAMPNFEAKRTDRKIHRRKPTSYF
jgi:hypothetical protein